MYELHGWVNLRCSPYDYDDGTLEAKVADLRRDVELLAGDAVFSGIRLLNDNYCYFVHGHPNAPRDYPVVLREILEKIAEILPGSYGVIYQYDEQQ